MDNTFAAPQGRLLPTLVAFAFVLGLLYTGYLAFTKYRLEGAIEDLATDTEALNAQIAVFKDQQVAEIYVAQQLKDQLKAETVRWSTVISKLQQLTPVGVFLSSYGIGKDGTIQLSGVADDFSAVSSIIAAMQDSKDFSGVFVPSVTAGSTSDGQSLATFSLSVQAVSQ